MLLTATLLLMPALALTALLVRRQSRNEQVCSDIRAETVNCGLTEPPSLHPVINVERCIGCGACVAACPENAVLGIVDGKADLIDPTRCIGHSACREACSMDAIELVFGTATRGMEIPHVRPNFETNVPGIFIAGELGGMGLIRNAIEQGRQAVEAIQQKNGVTKGDQLDLLIVGAGPAGFAASLAAKQQNLKCVTIEQDTLGGTVASYPRGKLVMTQPAQLPLIGRMQFKETTKEHLLDYWSGVETSTGIDINYRERLEHVSSNSAGFNIKTSRDSYQAHSVLLAIGRRGTPRKLGVPGEELDKVTYQLIDPEQYAGQHLLVVGGGDSALEAAASIAEQPGTTVTLSYRSEAFTRARQKNRNRLQALVAAGKITVLMSSTVTRITTHSVHIEHDGQEVERINNTVIICAGGILPTGFLENLGIEVNTKHGTT